MSTKSAIWFKKRTKTDGIRGINDDTKNDFDKKLTNDLLFVIGDTGSGKSITTPWYIFRYFSNCEIHFLQPRQVIVTKMNSELKNIRDNMIDDTKQFFYADKDYELSNLKIDYAHGDEKKDKDDNFKNSQLKIMTLGYYKSRVKTLLNNNNKTKVIIIDEAHEKNTDLEFILIKLKKYMNDSNKQIKIIIMSATLDTKDKVNYQNFFNLENDIEEININGNGVLYNIKEHYLKSPTPNYEETILNLIKELYKKKKDKNNFKVLVFLTGPAQIERLNNLCNTLSINERLTFYSGKKKTEEFTNFFSNEQNRYIIFATNIAETSFTFPKLDYVIDSGYARQTIYIPHFDLNTLMISQISNAERLQRRGRVGRDKDGEMYHIYTYETQQKMDKFPIPNISRDNLTKYILECLKYNKTASNKYYFLIEFLNSKICPKIDESLVSAIISLNDNNIINKQTFQDLKKIIEQYIKNDKIKIQDLDLNQVKVNLLNNVNFNNIINYQIYNLIVKMEQDRTQIKEVKRLKILLLCFEIGYINLKKKNLNHIDDIHFLLQFFAGTNGYNELEDKDKLNKLSQLYFKNEFNDIINGLKYDFDEVEQIKNIIKPFLEKNKAYYYQNNLYIKSKKTNFNDNNETILRIDLDRNSKCKLKSNDIIYYVKITLLDQLLINYCFKQVKTDEDTLKFKKLVEAKIKNVNIENYTEKDQNESKKQDTMFKSYNMNQLKINLGDEDKEKEIYKHYIFGGTLTNVTKDQVNNYKYLIAN
jgi:hypothetical protein